MSKKHNKIDLYYIVAFLFFVIGITGYFLGKGFLYNLSSNLITIGITVFVVQFFKDRADEKRDETKKNRLPLKD